MGNQSRGKYQVGVNDVYKCMALCGIILWINAAGITGVVAIEIEVEVSYESNEPYESCQQHESYQRRSGDENPVSVDENENIPTIFPGRCGDPAERAKFFNNALENSETKGNVITAVTACTRAELQDVSVEYSKAYGKTLPEAVYAHFPYDLSNEYYFYYVTHARVNPLSDHLANCLRVLSNGGTYDDRLAVIIGLVDDALPEAMRKAYLNMYKSHVYSLQMTTPISAYMEHNINITRILIHTLLSGTRSTGTIVDDEAACKDAHKIIETRDSHKWTDDYNEFLRILITRSFPQLRKISECFENITKVPLQKAIDDELSRYTAPYQTTTFKAVLEYAENKSEYFAKRLKAAVKGPGTYDNTLACIIPWRADIDLGSIKVAYQKLNEASLYDDVEDDTSGDYRALLLALIGK